MRLAIVLILVALTGCNDPTSRGAGLRPGPESRWVPLGLPEGCQFKQIIADEHGGVAVQCEDNRIFPVFGSCYWTVERSTSMRNEEPRGASAPEMKK